MRAARRKACHALAGAAMLALASAGAFASDPDIDAGRRFAEENCARCHSVGAAGASPVADAPPFRTFARKWPLENIEEALAEGIVVGHGDMPEFELSPRQIADLIGYLRTLGGK